MVAYKVGPTMRTKFYVAVVASDAVAAAIPVAVTVVVAANHFNAAVVDDVAVFFYNFSSFRWRCCSPYFFPKYLVCYDS